MCQAPVDATDETFFEEVIERSDVLPVVVHLTAPWSTPCRALGPLLDEIVAECGDRCCLVRVNIDASPFVTQIFQPVELPTVIGFKGQHVIERLHGTQLPEDLRAFVARLLAAVPPPHPHAH